jgi:hypothetical protein
MSTRSSTVSAVCAGVCVCVRALDDGWLLACTGKRRRQAIRQAQEHHMARGAAIAQCDRSLHEIGSVGHSRLRRRHEPVKGSAKRTVWISRHAPPRRRRTIAIGRSQRSARHFCFDCACVSLLRCSKMSPYSESARPWRPARAFDRFRREIHTGLTSSAHLWQLQKGCVLLRVHVAAPTVVACADAAAGAGAAGRGRAAAHARRPERSRHWRHRGRHFAGVATACARAFIG